jgi:hypothetical protein
MRYLDVQWIHTDPDDPIELVSELDDDAYETRKVEIFRDGSMGFASEKESFGSTQLGDQPVPSLEEIAADPQFKPRWISKEEFEALWARRRSVIATSR